MTDDLSIRKLRPAWLTDDQAWREQYDAMQLDEIQWINRHWTMADGAKPGLDMSWVTTETAGDPHWAWPVVLVALVCLPMIAALALIQITS